MEAMIISGKILLNACADTRKYEKLLERHQIALKPDGKHMVPYMTCDPQDAHLDPTALLDDLNSMPKSTYADGEIEFSGADRKTLQDYNYRLIYIPDSGKWKIENAKLSYPVVSSHLQRLEFLGCIIDVFEDFLTEKGIEIQNDEKEEDEDAAIIYGTDYDNLESSLESLLIQYNVLDPEKEEQV